MVDGISSSSSSAVQFSGSKPPSPEDAFKSFSKTVGGDGSTITKDQLSSYVSENSDDPMASDVAENFDAIDTDGDGSISSSDLDAAMKNGTLKGPGGGKPPEGPPPSSASESTYQTADSLTTEDLTSPIDLSV